MRRTKEPRTYLSAFTRDGKPSVNRTFYGITPIELMKLIEAIADRPVKRPKRAEPEPTAA